ncbi:EF-hand domain-containing family member C2 [Durusdinium trenchii]|uniref:EF-hand domain-containing family member C2 n=1 Tax=Durusdinium trenchii TaxID=1381693 RepID=A0ABP0JM21_9DINO
MDPECRTRKLQQSMSLGKIPNMPGLVSRGVKHEKHHKPQRFKVALGSRVEEDMRKPVMTKNSSLSSQTATLGELQQKREALLKEWEQVEHQMTMQQQGTKPSNQDEEHDPYSTESTKPLVASKSMPGLRVPPSWLKHDRKVLRYYMYFKEAVHESAVENHRVRRCILYFYLGDNTLAIEEPKEENSGLPQGIFLKRTSLKKDDGKPYTPEDFLVGTEATIFGRRFRVVDLDAKTREYLAERGVQAGEPEAYPDDPHRAKAREAQLAKNNKVPSIAGERAPDTLGKYLKNDNKVLRFNCLWDDTNRLYGEKNFYQLMYFLSDDTIEVRTSSKKQPGMDPFPLLLKRSKLVKDSEDPSQGFYQAEDLICGEYINCWGRKLMLLKCDDFTQTYYQRVHGYEQPEVRIREPPKKVVKNPVPPYNGFGSEADSLANCLNLVPKPVSQDLHRFLNNRGKTLKFRASFVKPGPEDADRGFLITYYMDDDTCAVYEPPKRNSGIMGGKFLERGKYKKPVLAKKRENEDLKVLKQTILDKIQSRMVGGPYALLRAFRKFGTDENGCITFENFVIGLRSIGILPTAFDDEQLRRLFSMYDNSGDMRIDYQEFVDHVMQDKPIATNSTRFSSRWLRSSDFYVGNVIQFMFPQTGATTQEFELLSADKQTLDLMAAHPDDFPKSNVEAIASMLAETLSENHVNVSDAFRVVDNEGKGWIYPEQFGDLLKGWALDFGLIGEDLTEHETLTLVRHYDKDGDGKIFYNEFSDALKKKKPLMSSGRLGGTVAAEVSVNEAAEIIFEKLQTLQQDGDLLQKFKQIDEDDSGRISWDEFRNMLRRFDIYLNNDKDRSFLMLKFDKNSDGLIDYQEFCESLFSKGLVKDGGAMKSELLARDPSELDDLNQRQDEAATSSMLEYQSLLQVSQAKEHEVVRIRGMMKAFTAKFVGKKKLFHKVLSSFDVDRTGFVNRREFSEALSRTNPDYGRDDRFQLINYVFPRAESELEYLVFSDIMFAQDVNKCISVFGHLPKGMFGDDDQHQD